MTDSPLPPPVVQGSASAVSSTRLHWAARVAGLFNVAKVLIWVVYFGFCAIVLILRFVVLPNIAEYRTSLESAASGAVHQRVGIGAVRAGWDGLRPHLTLTDVTIYDNANSPALHLPRVDATLAWESITVLQVRFHSLRLEGSTLDIRRDANGNLFVAGIAAQGGPANGSDGMLGWVLSQHEISITDASIRWTDELRGAAPLLMSKVNFTLRQRNLRHRFAFNAVPPAALAGPIDVRGYFDQTPFTRADDTRSWSGLVYANLDSIDLNAWHPYADYPIELTRGTGAMRAWVQIGREQKDVDEALPRLAGLVADISLADVSTRLKSDLPLLELTTVSGRVKVQLSPTHQLVTLTGVNVHSADNVLVSNINFSFDRTFSERHVPLGGKLSANAIDLDVLANVAERLPLAGDVRALLTQYHPQGVLRDLNLTWGGNFDAPSHYSVASRFDGLSLAAIPSSNATPTHVAMGQPGFSNVSGELSAHETGGSISLASVNGSFSLPGILEAPQTPFAQLAGRLAWKREAGALSVEMTGIHIENADLDAAISGIYRYGSGSGSNGPGSIDLTARLTRADAARVAHYMPAGIPEDVRRYLERAIRSGSSDDTSIRVKGPLEHFPFRLAAHAQGQAADTATDESTAFRIVSKLHHVDLDYAASSDPRVPSEWPAIADIDGELILDRVALSIVAKTAHVYGVSLQNVRADLPDTDDPASVLHVSGAGEGPLEDYVRFVNRSPIGTWIDQFTDHTKASGNAGLQLKLDLPFANMDRTKVMGSLTLQNNDITLSSTIPIINAANGKFEFSDTAFAVRGVSGQFLGGPMRLEGLTKSDGVVELRGDGTATADGLQRGTDNLFLMRSAKHFAGTSHYTLAINLPGPTADARAAAQHGPPLLVESTLSGMAINLPPPLKKTATESIALRVENFVPAGTKNGEYQETQIHLGSAVSVILAQRKDSTGELQFDHSAYGVNAPAVLLPGRNQMNLSVKSLDADAWQAVLADLNAPAPSSPVAKTAASKAPVVSANAFVPDVISLHATELTFDSKTLSNVALNASLSGDMWQANLQSDEISGLITWRDNGDGVQIGPEQNRLTAHLSRLSIPQSDSANVNRLLAPETQRSIPALEIYVDSFELHGKKLGRFELLASNVVADGKHEWQMSRLNLTSPDQTFEAHGTWGSDASRPGAPQRTNITFKLTTPNSGNLLDRMGLPGTIKDASATLGGDIGWQGSPVDFDYATLDGQLTLAAEKGQFLKTDPGLAKLLGVLSLQALPRRISLDFRDVFSEGFAFDTIGAHATIKDGVATTHDFHMAGVAANVLIDGSVDVAKETQNLHVLVIPEINAGAASLGYALLANPAIGLAAFIANYVLKDPISRALSFEYNITGSWTEPTIVKLSAKSKAAASATPTPAAAGKTP